MVKWSNGGTGLELQIVKWSNGQMVKRAWSLKWSKGQKVKRSNGQTGLELEAVSADGLAHLVRVDAPLAQLVKRKNGQMVKWSNGQMVKWSNQ